LGDVPCGPAPMLAAVHSNFFRRRNPAISQPSEQGHPVNSDLPCRFLRRICLHLCYTPIAYVMSSTKPHFTFTHRAPRMLHHEEYPNSRSIRRISESAKKIRKAVNLRAPTSGGTWLLETGDTRQCPRSHCLNHPDLPPLTSSQSTPRL